MIRRIARAGLLLAWVAAAAAVCAPRASAAGELRNGGFEDAGALAGWTEQGSAYGTADIVSETAASPPGALHVRINDPGSTGDKSFMLFQVIEDRSPWLGKKVRFGARVKTRDAGVSLVLYTPEGSQTVFDPAKDTDGFVMRSGAFDVPANASLLSFGIQVFGPAGGEAWVDDAFLELDAPEPTATPAATGKASARVQLDTGRAERTVSPLLFGMHIEWVENGLGLMDATEARLRKPAVDALKPLRVPLLRFPGGIHADYYDWKLGTGPAAERGTSKNAFTGKNERHRFGTPEYVDLLRELGADPLVTANYGTGTPAMAGEWAKRFAELGVSPKYWEVGNEIYLSGPNQDGPNGKAIWHTPEQYAADFPAYRDAIRKELPDAKVGAIAHLDTGAFPLAPAESRDWTVKMLAALTTRADFVAVHNAYAPVIIDDAVDFASEDGRRKAYRAMYAAALAVDANLDDVASTVTQLSPVNAGLPIAVTEFGPFFGMSTTTDMSTAYVDQSRTLAAAIYVASVLDAFIADPRVFLAAYTNPIHRWYGSLVTDTDQGLVKTPTYYLYELYRTRFEPRLVATDVVASPSFTAQQVGIAKAKEEVPDLLAKASLSQDGQKLTVMLVNRSLDRTLETRVEAKGFVARTADCLALAASAPNAINGPALGTTVSAGGAEIRPKALDCTAGEAVELSLPPSSVVSVVARK